MASKADGGLVGEFLTFMVWRGAVEYARKLVRKDDAGHYDNTWSHIWALQYANNYPVSKECFRSV